MNSSNIFVNFKRPLMKLYEFLNNFSYFSQNIQFVIINFVKNAKYIY